MSVVSLVNSEKVRQGSEVWHDGAATTRLAPAPTPEAEYGKPRQICQMAEDYNYTIRLSRSRPTNQASSRRSAPA